MELGGAKSCTKQLESFPAVSSDSCVRVCKVGKRLPECSLKTQGKKGCMCLMRARADKRRTGATSGPVRPRLPQCGCHLGPVALDVVGSYESLGFG